MYIAILREIIYGLFTSLRIDLLIKVIIENVKIRNHVMKIIKFNFLVYIVPSMILYLINSFTGISFSTIINILYYPLDLLSVLFHAFNYILLINNICEYTPKLNASSGAFATISSAITMSIYSMIIYLINGIICHIFSTNLYFISVILNLFLLTFYHSFYCFNNLWQYQKLDMSIRIDIHERIWPYYIGYGMLSSFIFMLTEIPYITGLYNIYITLLISIPFLIETRYPRSHDRYPRMNLSVFAYIMRLIVDLTKLII